MEACPGRPRPRPLACPSGKRTIPPASMRARCTRMARGRRRRTRDAPPNTGASRARLPLEGWADRIYNQSSESMPLPDESVALAFTSPPYNVGKDYDADLTLEQYLALIGRVGREVYRVLQAGRALRHQHRQPGAQALHPPARALLRAAHRDRLPADGRDHLAEGQGRGEQLRLGELAQRPARRACATCTSTCWCSARRASRARRRASRT